MGRERQGDSMAGGEKEGEGENTSRVAISVGRISYLSLGQKICVLLLL